MQQNENKEGFTLINYTNKQTQTEPVA